MIRRFEPALLDELLHGLHAEAYEIDRVGNAESEPNVKVVEDRLGRIDGLALWVIREHYFLIIIFL